jgi:Tetratricopeptide repeat
MALGNVLRGRKQFAECADVYSKGVDTISKPEKSNWVIYYFRGICFERAKQWAKAEADLKKSLELFPDWANSRTAVIKSFTNIAVAKAGTKASTRPGWMAPSGPAVMTKATSKASTTASASRRCARLGDKVERMKCCSSGTATAVIVIGAIPRRGWSARNQSYSASRLFT